jgi:hypothetical protein
MMFPWASGATTQVTGSIRRSVLKLYSNASSLFVYINQAEVLPVNAGNTSRHPCGNPDGSTSEYWENDRLSALAAYGVYLHPAPRFPADSTYNFLTFAKVLAGNLLGWV